MEEEKRPNTKWADWFSTHKLVMASKSIEFPENAKGHRTW